MSPPTSNMAMQQNRMQHPQMRQGMPPQMAPNSNGQPGAQFPNQRRRPMVNYTSGQYDYY
jgi:hypothetical protein